MTGGDWEQITAFDGPEEFRRFQQWLQDQVASGAAEEVSVAEQYSGSDFDEKWYRNMHTNEIWRLVAPDPPFYGVFESVPASETSSPNRR
jgi:hypothetical protein